MYISNDILDLVHTNLCGPMKVESYHYFILFVNDYSRKMIVMFLKVKSYTFQMFKWCKVRVKKETFMQLKCLRFDRGGKFMSDEFTNYCIKHGIKRQLSTPRTP